MRLVVYHKTLMFSNVILFLLACLAQDPTQFPIQKPPRGEVSLTGRKSGTPPCVIKTEDTPQSHFDLEGGAFVANIDSMKQVLFLALVVVALVPGCGKKSETSTPAPEAANPTAVTDAQAAKPPESPASAPIPAPIAAPTTTAGGANTNAPPDVAQLTFQLRRWIVMNHKTPKTFEEFVSMAKIQPPPAPPGKKYVLGPQAKVILADR
jgi:hypothetical protein